MIQSKPQLNYCFEKNSTFFFLFASGSCLRMPQSHAQARRNKAKKDAKAGVVKDISGKAPKAPETTVTCALCSLPLRVTKRNVEMKQHAEAKHPKDSFQTCWPGQTCE